MECEIFWIMFLLILGKVCGVMIKLSVSLFLLIVIKLFLICFVYLFKVKFFGFIIGFL